MKLLLDTHALLWWLDDPNMLLETARDAIYDPSNVVLVSSVSVWEIAIKRALGKLTAPDDLLSVISQCGFADLPIHSVHAHATESLPTHHRDPFDRMLVAQAIHENAILVSRDPAFDQYPVQILRI